LEHFENVPYIGTFDRKRLLSRLPFQFYVCHRFVDFFNKLSFYRLVCTAPLSLTYHSLQGNKIIIQTKNADSYNNMQNISFTCLTIKKCSNVWRGTWSEKRIKWFNSVPVKNWDGTVHPCCIGSTVHATASGLNEKYGWWVTYTAYFPSETIVTGNETVH